MTELTINQVDVAKLNVGLGEVILVTTERPITMEQYELIQRLFKRAFELSGGPVPGVLITDSGVKVTIIKAEHDPTN